MRFETPRKSSRLDPDSATRSRTEGAVLAATAFLIGSGLLLLAVEDVCVDGERLEGVGVTPTIEVEADAASAGSEDPQLNRAVAFLAGI